MQQGYSGSGVQRKGRLVEKVSSDQAFIESEARQIDLAALSRSLAILPDIDRIESPSIFMEFVEGREGLTLRNAPQAGKALRLLHEQAEYPHPCMTGLHWLIDLANENLALIHHDRRIPLELAKEYPPDTLIHSEPVQLIEKKDGSVVFIDFEGMGMGSRYQDLGFVYWHALKGSQPEIYDAFMRGYLSDGLEVEPGRVKQAAGIISLAYVGFALAYAGPEEADRRTQLGLRWIEEAGC